LTYTQYLEEWISVYSKSNWKYAQYTAVKGLIKNHVNPHIGEMQLHAVSPLDIEKLYNKLRVKKKKGGDYLSPTTIKYIHSTLKVAFAKAVEWQLINKSPVTCKAPKIAEPNITIWSDEMFKIALDNISHKQLHLAVHIAFICSLRPGEVLALTWEDINLDESCININKTIQRVNKEALKLLPQDELIHLFPNSSEHSSTSLILKTPKTKSSVRKVFITPPLKAELLERKSDIARLKIYLGGEYVDNNMVFALNDGTPVEVNLCTKWFKKWQIKSGLDFPMLTFHEIRHSSSTYKLRASGGDAKSVQGDTGHAKADTLLNTYSHIEDEQRMNLTKTIADDFYGESYEEPPKSKHEDIFAVIENNPELKKELLMRLLDEMK